jgi:hypothetical protein
MKSAIFTVPRDAMEGSLVRGLMNFGRNAECVEVAAHMLALPVAPVARAYIVMLSTVEWTHPRTIARLEELELALVLTYMLCSGVLVLMLVHAVLHT